MLWKNRRESTNVEDRRGVSGGRVAVGGGIGTLIILLIAVLLGADPRQLLQQVPSDQGGQAQQAPAPNPQEDQQVAFVKVVLADTEDVWHELFRARGQEYVEPHLVLFSDAVRSGCGNATSAVGPFYCPADSTVYLDLGFFREMTTRFRAPGDFAQAYVIAHEVGHHVQNLLGISGKVDRMRGRMSEDQANAMSVRLELQADFLAGVWAHHAQKMKNILEPGDIEEALNAANAIGDDTLQKQAQGYAVPDSFTHGTSAQRIAWFKKGYETGDMRYGDTFSARDLNHP